MCRYIHVYKCIYVYINIYTYIHTYTHTGMHKDRHTHAHLQICLCQWNRTSVSSLQYSTQQACSSPYSRHVTSVIRLGAKTLSFVRRDSLLHCHIYVWDVTHWYRERACLIDTKSVVWHDPFDPNHVVRNDVFESCGEKWGIRVMLWNLTHLWDLACRIEWYRQSISNHRIVSLSQTSPAIPVQCYCTHQEESGIVNHDWLLANDHRACFARHNALPSLAWPIPMFGVTHSNARRASFISEALRNHVWEMTHSCAPHDIFICETWLRNVRDTTHSYVWSGAFDSVWRNAFTFWHDFLSALLASILRSSLRHACILQHLRIHKYIHTCNAYVRIYIRARRHTYIP